MVICSVYGLTLCLSKDWASVEAKIKYFEVVVVSGPMCTT